MGSRTYVDVVPYVIHNAWSWDGVKISDKHMEVFFPRGIDYDEGVTTLNGWTCADETNPPDFVKDTIGKKGQIYPHEVWYKDDMVVYLVNESEYYAGGYYDVALVSDDKASLETFVKEMIKPIIKDKLEIEKDDGIQQTL